jgi:peptidoglycan/LPS O-acetylase OafA/YrhL
MPGNRAPLTPLTGLRFFLALWVVIFHETNPTGYIGPWASSLPVPLFALLRTGYLAVGVFFALSGFVLAYNYSLAAAWPRVQIARFAIARFGRIYPAYCVGLLLILPFTLQRTGIPQQIKAAVLNWTLLQSWFPYNALTWNSPGWSLSNEAFFYCCFPFIGLLLWKASSFRHILVLGLCLALLAMVAPAIAVSLPLDGFRNTPATADIPVGFWINLIKLNPLLRLPEFCSGILIARLYRLLESRKSAFFGRGYWLYVPALLIDLWVISFANRIPYPILHNGLLLPLHAAVILGLALGGGPLSRFLGGPVIGFLGNASYSVYILHYPLARWMNLAAGRLSPSRPLSGAGPMVLYTSLVVGLSAIVFKFVEEPGSRSVKDRLSALFLGPAPGRTAAAGKS